MVRKSAGYISGRTIQKQVQGVMVYDQPRNLILNGLGDAFLSALDPSYSMGRRVASFALSSS